MNTPDMKLRQLTDAWYDGVITPDEITVLEKRLETDQQARDYFFDVAHLEASLYHLGHCFPEKHPSPQKRILLTWLKAAAIFVVGLWLGTRPWQDKEQHSVTSNQSEVIAEVTGMLGIAREDASALHSVANGHEIILETGLAEITFASGTRALIEGPAAFQITDRNAMRFTHGKMVAEVPKGARGFTVSYKDGRIVDLGTEFGLEVPQGDGAANFGVFRGEIEFHPDDPEGGTMKLLENHALQVEPGNISSVPFDGEKFTRTLPTREFAWRIDSSKNSSFVMTYDVSHLMWKTSNYRAIIKWMKGQGKLHIQKMELLLDGRTVLTDEHPGSTGILKDTLANSYEFNLSEGQYRRGAWTLNIFGSAEFEAQAAAPLEGLLLFEEGLALRATEKDFVGTWEYLHNGLTHRRIFLADGTAQMTVNGEPYPLYKGSFWSVENGILRLDVSDGNLIRIEEQHVLRNQNTLIFIDQPYQNATKISNGIE